MHRSASNATHLVWIPPILWYGSMTVVAAAGGAALPTAERSWRAHTPSWIPIYCQKNFSKAFAITVQAPRCTVGRHRAARVSVACKTTRASPVQVGGCRLSWFGCVKNPSWGTSVTAIFIIEIQVERTIFALVVGSVVGRNTLLRELGVEIRQRVARPADTEGGRSISVGTEGGRSVSVGTGGGEGYWRSFFNVHCWLW